MAHSASAAICQVTRAASWQTPARAAGPAFETCQSACRSTACSCSMAGSQLMAVPLQAATRA